MTERTPLMPQEFLIDLIGSGIRASLAPATHMREAEALGFRTTRAMTRRRVTLYRTLHSPVGNRG